MIKLSQMLINQYIGDNVRLRSVFKERHKGEQTRPPKTRQATINNWATTPLPFSHCPSRVSPSVKYKQPPTSFWRRQVAWPCPWLLKYRPCWAAWGPGQRPRGPAKLCQGRPTHEYGMQTSTVWCECPMHNFDKPSGCEGWQIYHSTGRKEVQSREARNLRSPSALEGDIYICTLNTWTPRKYALRHTHEVPPSAMYRTLGKSCFWQCTL